MGRGVKFSCSSCLCRASRVASYGNDSDTLNPVLIPTELNFGFQACSPPNQNPGSAPAKPIAFVQLQSASLFEEEKRPRVNSSRAFNGFVLLYFLWSSVSKLCFLECAPGERVQ